MKFPKNKNWRYTVNQVTARARMKPKRRLLPWPPLEDCVWPRFTGGFPHTPLGIRPNQRTIKHAICMFEGTPICNETHCTAPPGSSRKGGCHAMRRWPWQNQIQMSACPTASWVSPNGGLVEATLIWIKIPLVPLKSKFGF